MLVKILVNNTNNSNGYIKGTIELNLLKEALEKTGNNKSKAARLLQIDRKTLYNKLKLYGLEQSPLSIMESVN